MNTQDPAFILDAFPDNQRRLPCLPCLPCQSYSRVLLSSTVPPPPFVFFVHVWLEPPQVLWELSQHQLKKKADCVFGDSWDPFLACPPTWTTSLPCGSACSCLALPLGLSSLHPVALGCSFQLKSCPVLCYQLSAFSKGKY